MVWVIFVLSSAGIVYAATQLARYGDDIAARTRLGGMTIGLILMATATSLPEVITSVSAIQLGQPDLAAGNLLGSNMFNMFLLAVTSLSVYRQRMLRKAAFRHAVSGSLTVLLSALVVFFIIAKIPARIGWVGVDSLILILIYAASIWLIQSNQPKGESEEVKAEAAPLGVALAGFVVAGAALVVITPVMVRSSALIAEITGLGSSFIGSTLVALATSLPEVAATLAAARIGAHDLAIGNLFGSNLFNIFALGLSDFFYTQGPFLSAVNPSFLLIGIIGVIMATLALVGNLARLDKRLLFFELDELALIVMYFGGLWLLYIRS